MLSRRRMICTALSKPKEELAYNCVTTEATYDGLTTNLYASVAKLKAMEANKKYLLKYDYYLEFVEIVPSASINDMGLRYSGAFAYTYSFRAVSNSGALPNPAIYSGHFENVLTCSQSQAVGTDLLRVFAISCKIKARVWNISLTEV